MKPKTIRIPIKGWSEAKWLAHRKNGLGGSDMSALLGLSDYKSPLELYLEKIGEPVFEFKGNKFTEAGHEMEPIIRCNYQYFELGQDANRMYENKKAGKKVNQVRIYPYIVSRTDLPWLFGNIDGAIPTKYKKRGGLECKNMTSYARNKHVNGIDPGHIIQTQTYLLLTQWDYWHLAIRTDGFDMDVYEFEPIEEIQNEIMLKSAKFWMNVEKARAIKEEYGIKQYYGINLDFFHNDVKEAVMELQSMEPDMTGELCESEFIKSFIKPTPEFSKCDGSDDLLACAQKYHEALQQENEFKKSKEAWKSKAIRMLGGYHEADYGDKCVISYKEDAAGRMRFNVSKRLLM